MNISNKQNHDEFQKIWCAYSKNEHIPIKPKSDYLTTNNTIVVQRSNCNLPQCASLIRLNGILSRYHQFITSKIKTDTDYKDEKQNKNTNNTETIADNSNKTAISTSPDPTEQHQIHSDSKTGDDSKMTQEQARQIMQNKAKELQQNYHTVQLKALKITQQKMAQKMRIYALSHPEIEAQNAITEFTATYIKQHQQIIALQKNAAESAKKMPSPKITDIIYNTQRTGKIIENLFDEDYTNTLVLNDFHHLLFYHAHEFEDIYNLLTQCNDNACNVTNCSMFRRNRRDRTSKGNIDTKIRAMYFNLDNGYDIVQQQLLDTIHCHFFHSFDIGYRLTRKEINDMEHLITNNEENSEEMKQSESIECGNEMVQKMFEINNSKKQFVGNDSKSSNKFLTSTDIKHNDLIYSNGIRYFYWDFYKTTGAISLMDVASISSVASNTAPNEGYILADWYIVPLFANVKDEILKNGICTISAVQWIILVQKAYAYLQTNQAKKIFCQHPRSQLIYGIVKGSPITLTHLVAMMLYCNNDTLQRKFSATYRRKPNDETDENLMKRHQNYAHLGRLLREIVECFGADEHYLDFKHLKLYHGISIHANFSSSIVCFKGPVSTSLDYSVAVNFCANTGAILEFNLGPNWGYQLMVDLNTKGDAVFEKGMAMFECFWLSDYPNEQECFFIGGYSNFTIISIVTAPNGKDYSAYTAALNKLFACIADYGGGGYARANILSGHNEDMVNQICFRILLHKLHSYYPNDNKYVAFDSAPKYAKSLIDAHFNSIRKLQLFVRDDDVIQQLIQCMFFNDCGWVDLNKLCIVFPSVMQIEFECKRTDSHFIDNKSTYLAILLHLKMNPNTKIKYFAIAFLYKDKSVERAAAICNEFSLKFNQLKYIMFVDDSMPNFGRIRIQCDQDEMEENMLKMSKSRIARMHK